MSCHDSIEVDGSITAIQNNNIWKSDVYAYYDNTFGDSLISIVGKVYNSQGFLSEEIAFYKVPTKPGSYKTFLANAPHSYAGIGVSFTKLEGDGHVISEFYELDTSYINTFDVVNIDFSLNKLEANFGCRLLHITNQNDTLYTLFEKGVILTTIEK